MPATWTCPECGRVFRQKNQAHSCGVGSRAQLLRSRPEALVKLYQSIEATVKKEKGTEVVAKNRCALFRTTRIFADLVVMKDALRLAILLPRAVKDPIFFKSLRMSTTRVAHVTLIRTRADWIKTKPYLVEAYRFARIV